MKLRSIKSRLVKWRLRKNKPVRQIEPTVVDELSDCVSDTMQDTVEEIADALHYYFLNPNKLSYDMAYELTMEDIIFPVSGDGGVRNYKRLER